MRKRAQSSVVRLGPFASWRDVRGRNVGHEPIAACDNCAAQSRRCELIKQIGSEIVQLVGKEVGDEQLETRSWLDDKMAYIGRTFDRCCFGTGCANGPGRSDGVYQR